MAQRSLSQWFSSSSGKSSQQQSVFESDSEEDLLNMECTPVDSSNDMISDSDEDQQQELAPPVSKKVAKSVSCRYKTKHSWLISDETGKGAYCKFC